tara:strand:+ start:393 stop:1487 length:1095 start_codon:yes stop_codon:yes gene_type:complete
MIVQDIVEKLDELAPLAYAEDYDNIGLLIGDKKEKVKGILITLDVLPEVIDEAIENNCNLIVSFHPIIFNSLKKITGKTYVERVIQKAIKHDISIFAIHTALDNAFEGVNSAVCNILNLKNKSILIPQSKTIKKLTTYVPSKDAKKVREALFKAGGGSIGNYENCSFNSNGIGTYKGNNNSNPYFGKPNKDENLEEIKIDIIYAKHLESSILSSLFDSHPYESVAYEIYTLENRNQFIGMGMIGDLEEKISENDFINFVKKTMKSDLIRHSKFINKPIKKVAVLAGSGSFAIESAKLAKADAFITSDLKYHDFFKAENELLLLDIGHYESEQYTKKVLEAYLKKKIPNFAILLSKINTNPVKYK